ncbi:hypothetical protein [Halobacteriovorax sp.]|uniref:hypothetical protein n=1 Tax=Halobacteriovorax sp. TaxID=2020862 RepID=UPI003569D45B
MFKMFSCKDISKATCHSDDLNLAEKLNYKMHLLICGNCRKYAHGIEVIGEKFTEVLKKKRNISSEKITQLENRILESIKKNNESE